MPITKRDNSSKLIDHGEEKCTIDGLIAALQHMRTQVGGAMRVVVELEGINDNVLPVVGLTTLSKYNPTTNEDEGPPRFLGIRADPRNPTKV